MTTKEEILGIRQLVQNAISTATPTDAELICLTTEFLFDPGRFDVVDSQQQLELLKGITTILSAAFSKLEELHPTVRRNLEFAFRDKAPDYGVRFFAGDDPYICNDQIEVLVDYLLTGLQCGQVPIPGKGAQQEAKKLLRFMPKLSQQQRTGETWKKVALVNAARVIWRNHAERPKGKNVWPPRIPSSGPYYDFVASLIDFHELGWNVHATFRARNELGASADTWGWS